MSGYQLDFEKLIEYDAGESGININATLKISGKTVSFSTKLDTGSALCIFERNTAKNSALKSKKDFSKKSARRPEFLSLTASESFCKLKISSSIRSFILPPMKISIVMFWVGAVGWNW